MKESISVFLEEIERQIYNYDFISFQESEKVKIIRRLIDAIRYLDNELGVSNADSRKRISELWKEVKEYQKYVPMDIRGKYNK